MAVALKLLAGDRVRDMQPEIDAAVTDGFDEVKGLQVFMTHGKPYILLLLEKKPA